MDNNDDTPMRRQVESGDYPNAKQLALPRRRASNRNTCERPRRANRGLLEAMTRQELAADFYLFASLYSGKDIRVKFLTKREAKRFFKALKASAKRTVRA